MSENQSVERMLGQFGAKLDTLANETSTIRERVDETHTIVVRNEVKAEQIAETVKEHAVDIEDYKKTKARGLGVIAGIFAVGTFVGVAIDKMVALFRFGGQG